MNPDRLPELRRQRAAIQEHLAWLDHEIAAATGSSSPPPAPDIPAAEVPAPAPLPAFGKYQADPVEVRSDTRRGCLLYFFITLAVIGLSLVAGYFAFYRDRPLF